LHDERDALAFEQRRGGEEEFGSRGEREKRGSGTAPSV